jgi:hypothetical protein
MVGVTPSRIATSIRRTFLLAALVLVGAARGQVTITKPGAESICDAETIAAGGTADAGRAVLVTLWDDKGNRIFEKEVMPGPAGLWEIGAIAVPASGAFLLVAQQPNTAAAGSSADAVLVSRRPAGGLAGPAQQVRIVWEDGADNVLKDIANQTLDNPTPNEVAAFVDLTHGEVRAVVQQVYEAVNVQLLPDGAPDGPFVTTVHVEDVDADQFGSTDLGVDVGNLRKHDDCHVLPKTVLKCMTGTLEQGSGWGSLVKKSDRLTTRAADVGQCLGRTAAHELGHALGLVPGGWMRGADQHTDPRLDDAFTAVLKGAAPVGTQFRAIPEARWDQGRYLMDANLSVEEKTYLVLAHYRLGEPDAELRQAETLPRLPARFNAMNRSYLALILPR